MWVHGQEAVGAALTAARRRSTLSQIEVARRLTKRQSFVSNYEKGQRRVDILEFVRIANAIGAGPRKLFGDIVRRLRERVSPQPVRVRKVKRVSP